MIFEPCAGIINIALTKKHQNFDVHVVFDGALTGKSKFPQVVLGLQFFFLSFGHTFGFAIEEIYPAGSAARLTATPVQRMATIVFQCKHQAGTLIDINRSNAFNC